MRGLKAPPRSIVAPAAATARQLSMVCSRDSTVQGPAMRPKWSPPRRRPPTWMTVGSGVESADTSLYGLRIGSTFSTPASSSSERLLSISRSPNAPITIDSLPGATRP